MGKLVCFGELMMRLNPEGYGRFVQADRYEVSYAGGEANVAVDAVQLGMESEFVTKLPDQELGYGAANALRRFGVNTEKIVYGGPRLGVYFVEKGASQRSSKVIYDRAGSSIALAKPSDFDWKKILEGASWFHFTGITPALKGYLPQICREACETARKKGIVVSCDLNYRKKLWSRQEAGAVMEELMPLVDVCIANEEDISDVFGIRAENSDVEEGYLDPGDYQEIGEKMERRFGLSYVAITLRKSLSASRNLWSAMLYGQGKSCFSREYDIQIVDRVGGGDSFAGGLIYALSKEHASVVEPDFAGGDMPFGKNALRGSCDLQYAVEFAAAASCLKHTIEHDFNLVSAAEVESLMNGSGSGRVQR